MTKIYCRRPHDDGMKLNEKLSRCNQLHDLEKQGRISRTG